MLNWFRRLSETTQGLIVTITLGLILFGLLSWLGWSAVKMTCRRCRRAHVR